MPSYSRAVVLTWTTGAGAIVSDNIHREGKGFEEEGALFSQRIGVQLSDDLGRRSYSLKAGGGWETLDSESLNSSEEIYDLELNISLPLTRSGHVEGTAGTSRETVSPEPDDLDQRRRLVKHSRVGLLAVREASELSRWEAGLNARREDKVDLELEEIAGRVQWSRDLSRVRTFSVRGSGHNGSDDFESTSWQGFSAAISLMERVSKTFSRTLTLDWEERTFEEKDGSKGTSWIAGIEARYASQPLPDFLHKGSLGVSMMSQSSGEGSWEPRASFSLEKALSRTTAAEGSVEFRTLLRDPGGDEVERRQRGRSTAGLIWRASRKISVSPRVSYLYEDINGEEVQDREDGTFISRVDAQWTPHSAWLMELGFIAEEQESTDPTEELTEKRVVFNVSGTFR